MLGERHVATLCSELVRAQAPPQRNTSPRSNATADRWGGVGRQVLLLRNTSSEYDKCEELLESQLTLCEEAPHLPISPHISPYLESQLTLCEEARASSS